jgi:hypothetical protein
MSNARWRVGWVCTANEAEYLGKSKGSDSGKQGRSYKHWKNLSWLDTKMEGVGSRKIMYEEVEW